MNLRDALATLAAMALLVAAGYLLADIALRVVDATSGCP